MGYKEIEVSFPAASEADFAFTRMLVETPDLVPDDVWIQVFMPCRPELIRRTVESVRGARNVILHMYIATNSCFQQMVLGLSEDETVDLAASSTKLLRSLSKDDGDQQETNWAFAFACEHFTDSRPSFALRVCEAVKQAWQPTKENPIIFNLPATVELSTPNVYADQIEWFARNISDRETVCVSLHPHNDRGCAVAAAELGQLAGADRVEGVLFGHGERTGNVDLITLAANMEASGIVSGLDLGFLEQVKGVVEKCVGLPCDSPGLRLARQTLDSPVQRTQL